jgi:hypothetical protein
MSAVPWRDIFSNSDIATENLWQESPSVSKTGISQDALHVENMLFTAILRQTQFTLA